MIKHVMSWLPAECCAAYRGGYVAIGNFDGVHRGHRVMVDRLVARAHAAQAPAIVTTFDPHPLALLRAAGAPPSLTTIAQRTELLRQAGVDAVLVLPTSRDLLRLTAEEFFQQLICTELAAKGLVEGPNFSFGRDRGGSITTLRQMCLAHGMTLDVIDPVTWNGQWVSSSVIRSLLLAGDVTDANELLGHPYAITGLVKTGAQRGRTLGFPTANLTEIATVLPGHGVYAGACEVGGRGHPVAVNIGPNPTFGEGATKVEAHLLDFAGELYGQGLTLQLLVKLRDVRPFPSVDALQLQLADDMRQVRQFSLTR